VDRATSGVMHQMLGAMLIFLGLFLVNLLNGASSPACDHQDLVIEEVYFRQGDNVLAGSLFRPRLAGQHPAIILILGSGAQDRAYGGVGTALGMHFARHGFVCLAWDKPGVGKSSGDYQTQTFRDRADEALAAMRFLRGRDEVRPDRIGIWGHSQGGMVAPLAASRSSDVAFVIEVAGWQGPAWQQDPVRVEAELRAANFSEADIQKAVAFTRMRMDLIRGTGPFEELEKAQDRVHKFSWFKAVHRCDRGLFYSARRLVEYDSEASWEKVRCPVLAIYGDKDVSSGPPEGLLAIIRRGLRKAGNQDLTIAIYPDADHSLCKTEASGRKERDKQAERQKTADAPNFVPGYLDEMTTWLNKRVGSRP